jgi:hypothetical protein
MFHINSRTCCTCTHFLMRISKNWKTCIFLFLFLVNLVKYDNYVHIIITCDNQAMDIHYNLVPCTLLLFICFGALYYLYIFIIFLIRLRLQLRLIRLRRLMNESKAETWNPKITYNAQLLEYINTLYHHLTKYERNS